MSYALELTADATIDLQQLDPILAELTIDELDRVADAPSLLRIDLQGEAVHDFDAHIGTTRHVIFIPLRVDEATRTVIVRRIIDHRRA